MERGRWVHPIFTSKSNARLDTFGGDIELNRAFIFFNVAVTIQIIKDVLGPDEFLNPLLDNVVLFAGPTHHLIDRIYGSDHMKAQKCHEQL